MRKIKSNVKRRQACPFDPGAPQVELTIGGDFEVTDAMAALLVERGEAEYIDNPVKQLELEFTETIAPTKARKARR